MMQKPLWSWPGASMQKTVCRDCKYLWISAIDGPTNQYKHNFPIKIWAFYTHPWKNFLELWWRMKKERANIKQDHWSCTKNFFYFLLKLANSLETLMRKDAAFYIFLILLKQSAFWLLLILTEIFVFYSGSLARVSLPWENWANNGRSWLSTLERSAILSTFCSTKISKFLWIWLIEMLTKSLKDIR